MPLRRRPAVGAADETNGVGFPRSPATGGNTGPQVGAGEDDEPNGSHSHAPDRVHRLPVPGASEYPTPRPTPPYTSAQASARPGPADGAVACGSGGRGCQALAARAFGAAACPRPVAIPSAPLFQG